MKPFHRFKRNKCWLLIPFSLIACGLLQPAAGVEPEKTSNPIDATPLPVQTYPENNVSDYRIELKISTTSDWTTVQLLRGKWDSLSIVSSSEQAQNAGIDGEILLLNQSIERAESDQGVEMLVEGYISISETSRALKFEIDRGHIGATHVEVRLYKNNITQLNTLLVWEAINPGERNIKVFEVPVESESMSRPAAKLNEYIVIGQLNFWYYGPGEFGGFENSDGSRATPLTPLLGKTYWASDPDVIHQQIEWAVEYGVDAFSIEWTTPRGVGCCGSMEDTLDDVFLKSANIHNIRWVIFYDFILRLDQTKELGIDMSHSPNFNQPAVYDTFVADFVHFAKKYFGHPQYLTIDGRPVIYIWATNGYTGNFAGAMEEARKAVSELGFDVFIVGDEVCVGCFTREHAALFDGSSTFTFLIPGIDIYSLNDVGQAALEVDRAFQWWRQELKGLKVTGRDEYVNFQPAWAPQYDERSIKGFDPAHTPIYVPATSKDQVFDMAMVARKHAEPVGSEGLKIIWLNTWNNWAETTTVEPTANLGPKYPAANYQFDMLEVVREVFGPETYFTSSSP